MHEAFGIDPTEYDYKVFRITSEISKQVFPLTLDIDHPAFRAGLERLRLLHGVDRSGEEAWRPRRRAAAGRLGAASAAATFARLYFLPVRQNELPEQVRMAPAW